MENIKIFPYEVQNRILELTIGLGANPINKMHAILIDVREKNKIIGRVRFTIPLLALKKYDNSWTPFIDAAYKLFVNNGCAESLFAIKQISISGYDIDEEFEFL